MRRLITPSLAVLLLGLPWLLGPALALAQRYAGSDGRLRVALVKQPFSPTGTSSGPDTMAQGGVQQVLAGMGAVVRVEEAALTPDEATERTRISIRLRQRAAARWAECRWRSRLAGRCKDCAWTRASTRRYPTVTS